MWVDNPRETNNKQSEIAVISPGGNMIGEFYAGYCVVNKPSCLLTGVGLTVNSKHFSDNAPLTCVKRLGVGDYHKITAQWTL